MVSSKMYIPKTIKVGYQKRTDTYTGQLAYVIYTDDKGKLRKENSWQSWRNHKISPEDFDNEPTSGFVLNKGVGGARQSYGWNARNEYIRVYDPRNFEFEISVANLLFILQECSAIKGKGLEGEFVYAWAGTELVLLPVGCEEYKECVKHTERQKVKFDKKDIKEGYSYIMKDGTEVMYLGRHNYNEKSYYSEFNPKGKKHVFLRLKKEKYKDPYIPQPGFTKIAECTSSSALPQFPDEYDKFKKSVYCGDIKSIKVEKIQFSDNLIYKNLFLKIYGKYYTAKFRQWYNYGFSYSSKHYMMNKSNEPFVPEIKNNGLKVPPTDGSNDIECSEKEMKKKELYVVTVITEQGKKMRV